jgi:Sulfotransferase family
MKNLDPSSGVPKARIVHCRRHPIDTCFSCYMQEFVGIRFATSLDDLAAVYRLYLKIMAHCRSVLPGSLLCDVSYEELVCRPEETIRQLLEFCGLTFEESCRRFSLHFDQTDGPGRNGDVACPTGRLRGSRSM